MMSEGISIIWDGVREFRDRIDEIIEKADIAARKAVTDGGHLIERNAKMRVSVKTGTLRRSIHVDSVLKLGPGRWESKTGPSVIYARQHEFGGTITPKHASVLAWVTSGARPTSAAGWQAARAAGIAVFAKSVTQQPHPFMKPAFDESVSGLREIYRLAFREALEK